MTLVHTRELAPNHGASRRTAASSTAMVAAPATAATARIGPDPLRRSTLRAPDVEGTAPLSW